MMHFAEAKKEDIPGIIEVMKDSGYANFVYHGRTDDYIKNDILASDYTYLICFEKLSKPRNIVGYFIFSKVDDHLDEARGHITVDKRYAYHLGIGVHSDYRKLGLGKKLTLYALKKARQQGFRGMYADVGSNNKGSLRLQEAVGFKRIAQYPSKKRKMGINIVFEIQF